MNYSTWCFDRWEELEISRQGKASGVSVQANNKSEYIYIYKIYIFNYNIISQNIQIGAKFRRLVCTMVQKKILHNQRPNKDKNQWTLTETLKTNVAGDSVSWWNLSSLETFQYPIPIAPARQHGPQPESNTSLSQTIFLFRGVSSNTGIDPARYTVGGGRAQLLSQTQRTCHHLNRIWL